MSVHGRYCCKSRKSNDAKNLANVDFWTSLPLQCSVAPLLIMENAALAAIRPYLDRGESAVGTAIHVRHLTATPVGHEVRAEAEVVKVEGKRIEFKVSASDETEEIGSGTH